MPTRAQRRRPPWRATQGLRGPGAPAPAPEAPAAPWRGPAADDWRAPTCRPPVVSIILRAHNPRREWFEAALQSALAQEHVRVEVLVVDDASEPPVEVPPDPRVGLLRLGWNRGAGQARVLGARLCRGRYVTTLDDDDELLPFSCAKRAMALAEDRDTRLAAGTMLVFDNERGVRGGADWPQIAALRSRWDGRPEALIEALLACGENLLPGPTVMWRRGDHLPEEPSDFVIAEDGAFWRLALATADPGARLALLPDALVRYRVRDGSLSGGWSSPAGRIGQAACNARVAMSRNNVQHELLARGCRRPLRLAFLASELDVGGAQWATVQLCERLDRRLVEPVIVAGRETPLAAEARRRGVPVLVKQDPAQTREDGCLEALRELRPDVVDIAWEAGLLTERVAEAARPARLFVHAQSTHLSSAMLAEETSPVLARCDHVICVGRDVQSANPGFAGKSSVIYSPVDSAAHRQARAQRDAYRALLGIPPEAVVVVWSGRITSDLKRWDVLRGIVERCPELRFLILGALHPDHDPGGRVTAEWRGWEAQHPSSRWLAGVLPWQTPVYLAAADLYLSTSEVEGLSLGMLEAMAAGIPCVMREAGGVREALHDGVTGLVDRRGTAEGLSALLRRLAADPETRAAMGRLASRVAAAVFDVREASRRHALVYHGQQPVAALDGVWPPEL